MSHDTEYDNRKGTYKAINRTVTSSGGPLRNSARFSPNGPEVFHIECGSVYSLQPLARRRPRTFEVETKGEVSPLRKSARPRPEVSKLVPQTQFANTVVVIPVAQQMLPTALTKIPQIQFANRVVGLTRRATDAAHQDPTDSVRQQSGGHTSHEMVSTPTHEGLNAVAHHGTSSAPTNEDEISCIRASFKVRLLQRFLARLGPSEGDESEEENSWVDSVVWDEGEKDGMAAISRWLSADGHLDDGCRACSSADGSWAPGSFDADTSWPTLFGGTGRKVQYKLDVQSLRLFGHQRM